MATKPHNDTFNDLLYCRKCGTRVSQDADLCDLCAFCKACCKHGIVRLDLDKEIDIPHHLPAKRMERNRHTLHQTIAAQAKLYNIADRRGRKTRGPEPYAVPPVVPAAFVADEVIRVVHTLRDLNAENRYAQSVLARATGVGDKTISSFVSGSRASSMKVTQLVALLYAHGKRLAIVPDDKAHGKAVA